MFLFRNSNSPRGGWKRRAGFSCGGGKKSHRRSHWICLSVLVYALGVLYTFNALFYKVDFSEGGKTGNGSSQKWDKSGRNSVQHVDTFLETVDFQFQGDPGKKRILFWTKFYKEDRLRSFCIRPDSLQECPYTQCEFINDKSLLQSSDALVFHGRDLTGKNSIQGYEEDLYLDMPKLRSKEQLWVFLMFEAPIHTWINLEPFDDVFNMTMTYRPDSDIYIPYGRLIPLEPGESPQRPPVEGINKLNNSDSTKKQGLVAWSVSNCYKTPSRRNEVVHELHKYIQIDIYGDCGSETCTPFTSVCDAVLECHEFLGRQKKYKFYLAFENSLCENYITEKFFDSLHVGMVPVVYGYGDYSLVAPKGSYIDATVFPSMKSLADYLYHLDAHPTEYAKYFEWRDKFKVSVSYFDSAWCSLCTKLWTVGQDGNPPDISSSHQKGADSVRDVLRKEKSNPRNPRREMLDSKFAPEEILDGKFSLEKMPEGEIPRGKTSEVKSRRVYQVHQLSKWWFSKSLGNLSDSAATKRENACIDPLRLKWDRTMFSFYGFIYYPNYLVKMWILCVLSLFLFGLAAFYSCRHWTARNRRDLGGG